MSQAQQIQLMNQTFGKTLYSTGLNDKIVKLSKKLGLKKTAFAVFDNKVGPVISKSLNNSLDVLGSQGLANDVMGCDYSEPLAVVVREGKVLSSYKFEVSNPDARGGYDLMSLIVQHDSSRIDLINTKRFLEYASILYTNVLQEFPGGYH